MAQLPALPPGFELESAAPAGASQVIPPLPPGFELESAPNAAQASPAQAAPSSPVRVNPRQPVTPGSTFDLGAALGGMVNGSGGPPGPTGFNWNVERRGSLAPVIRNQTTGALRLAMPQAALDAMSALKLPGDVASGQTPFDPRGGLSQQDPNTLNRAAGLAAMMGTELPLAERGMTPARTSGLIGPTGARIPSVVARDLVRSNIAPQDVNARLESLGPGGLLADLSPILQGRTAKLATLPEPAQQTIADTLGTRQAAASDRVPAGLANIAGLEPVPSTVQAAIDARKETIGAHYEPLFAKAKPIDPTSIVNNLNGNIAMMRGPAQKALSQVRQMFDLPSSLNGIGGGQQITKDPRTLFEIRNAIDGMMETETNTKVIGALTNVRQRVDTMLATSMPQLKQLDAIYQEQANQQSAFDLGRRALAGGEAPLHPDDLAAAMQKTAMSSSIGPIKYPSAAPGFIGQGLVSKMYEIVGNNVNDRLSLRKIITGDESKWNYQKIAAALGSDKAEQLLALFKNEATMAQTENLALAGSKTARMASGGEGMEANPSSAAFLRNALNLKFGDIAQSGLDRLTGGISTARREGRNQKIAQTLMSPGPFKQGPSQAQIPSMLGFPLLPPLLFKPAMLGAIAARRSQNEGL